jgi:hypothetical protein
VADNVDVNGQDSLGIAFGVIKNSVKYQCHFGKKVILGNL